MLQGEGLQLDDPLAPVVSLHDELGVGATVVLLNPAVSHHGVEVSGATVLSGVDGLVSEGLPPVGLCGGHVGADVDRTGIRTANEGTVEPIGGILLTLADDDLDASPVQCHEQGLSTLLSLGLWGQTTQTEDGCHSGGGQFGQTVGGPGLGHWGVSLSVCLYYNGSEVPVPMGIITHLLSDRTGSGLSGANKLLGKLGEIGT